MPPATWSVVTVANAPPGLEHACHLVDADGLVDPVERGERDDGVERRVRERPVLERRHDHLRVRIPRQVACRAPGRGSPRAPPRPRRSRVRRGRRSPAPCRTRSPARDSRTDAGQREQVVEERIGVARARAVVELGVFVEDRSQVVGHGPSLTEPRVPSLHDYRGAAHEGVGVSGARWRGSAAHRGARASRLRPEGRAHRGARRVGELSRHARHPRRVPVQVRPAVRSRSRVVGHRHRGRRCRSTASRSAIGCWR